MARPQKSGIEYFPLDVDMDQDDKMQLIEAQFGITGFGIVIKLLMKIYKEGYFYKWTERAQLLFSKRVNVDINLVNDVINECVKWELFDSGMFENYNILTSKGIQRRYLEATYRRKHVEIIKEFCLINVSNYSNIVFVNINTLTDIVNVDINTPSDVVNDNIGTQSKVKESKVKKNKVKENIYYKSDSTNPTQHANPTESNSTTAKKRIFEHWNSKGIIVHRKMTDKIKRAINSALRDYTEDEICTAIDNYAVILSDDHKYYWTYKWGLKEFLQRGVDKFIDFSVAAQNYARKNIKTPDNSSSFPPNIQNALDLVERTREHEETLKNSIWEAG